MENKIIKNEITSDLIGKYLRSLGTNLNKDQTEAFVEVCKSCDLNPFKREIYGIIYNNTNKKTGEKYEVVVPIVNYQTYISRANASGLCGGIFTKFLKNNEGTVACQVEIVRKDWNKPYLTPIIPITEYAGMNDIWKRHPYLMLEKCAVVRALRFVFPEYVNSLPYIPEESAYLKSESVEELLNEDAKNKKEPIVKDTPILDLEKAIKDLEK